MKSRDRNLGMDRAISRRDLLHGMGALAAGALCTPPNQMFALENTGAAGYPPALTGFRGSHVGSFEVAHQLARTGRRDWGTVQGTDDDIYDLVVVGGGLSGLAAAHFFLKQRPKARILILDNHDDFGGHARRNEFQIDGRTLIGYGGNQSLGGYSFAKSPDDPITVHMERFPHRSNEGLTLREQNRIGRREMLSTSFETIERHIRSQLGGMLGSGGFDPARDIEGITVNRWPHGYSYSWYNPLFDKVYWEDDDERYPHIRARKRFGRIAIANADAGANAMLETAVEQGHRAVTELT